MKTLKNRLEQVYLDKLDGKVSEDFWREKSQIWQAEHDGLLAQLQNYQVSNRTFEAESGLKLIELAAQAYELYSKQPPAEKINSSKLYFRTAHWNAQLFVRLTKNLSTCSPKGSKLEDGLE